MLPEPHLYPHHRLPAPPLLDFYLFYPFAPLLPGIFLPAPPPFDSFFPLPPVPGFLVGNKFVNLKSGASFLDTVVRDAIIRRACRLWPVLIGVATMGLWWLGEGEGNWWTLAQVLSFTNNLFDVRKYGRVSF